MSKPNLLFFTWASSYQLDQTLEKRKQSFSSKYGDAGIYQLSGEQITVGALQDALMGGGFFATKSLVILKGVPTDKVATNKLKAEQVNTITEFLQKNRDTIWDDKVLILVSYTPDKRTKAYKFFSKHATLKTFSPPKESWCVSMIQQQLWSLITYPQAKLIQQYVGTDERNLLHECQKLTALAQHRSLTSLDDDTILDIITPHAITNNFALLDARLKNSGDDTSKTLKLIDDVHAQRWTSTEWPIMTMWMLYRWFKGMLSVLDLDKQWITSAKEIASQIKMPPFTVSKHLKNIATLRTHETYLRTLYPRLLQLDYDLKTWWVTSETFWVHMKMLVEK